MEYNSVIVLAYHARICVSPVYDPNKKRLRGTLPRVLLTLVKLGRYIRCFDSVMLLILIHVNSYLDNPSLAKNEHV